MADAAGTLSVRLKFLVDGNEVSRAVSGATGNGGGATGVVGGAQSGATGTQTAQRVQAENDRYVRQQISAIKRVENEQYQSIIRLNREKEKASQRAIRQEERDYQSFERKYNAGKVDAFGNPKAGGGRMSAFQTAIARRGPATMGMAGSIIGGVAGGPIGSTVGYAGGQLAGASMAAGGMGAAGLVAGGAAVAVVGLLVVMDAWAKKAQEAARLVAGSAIDMKQGVENALRARAKQGYETIRDKGADMALLARHGLGSVPVGLESDVAGFIRQGLDPNKAMLMAEEAGSIERRGGAPAAAVMGEWSRVGGKAAWSMGTEGRELRGVMGAYGAQAADWVAKGGLGKESDSPLAGTIGYAQDKTEQISATARQQAVKESGFGARVELSERKSPMPEILRLMKQTFEKKQADAEADAKNANVIIESLKFALSWSALMESDYQKARNLEKRQSDALNEASQAVAP